jgi:hypothetical protein
MTEMASQDKTAPGLDTERAWGAQLSVLYCPHCHSTHLAPEDVPVTTCPACLGATLSPQPEQLRREPPELVIPFAVGEAQAEAALTEWARGWWFRPDERRADLLLSRLRHYYFPLWLVDADLQATWQAEMGYDYQAASYRERYVGGRWISEEVTETHVRWEPRLGRLERHYDNVAAPALEEHDLWMSRLGGYDYQARKAYSSRAITQSMVRVPDRGPEAAWPGAEQALEHTAAQECRTAAEADHMRNWGMRAEYKGLNWTQLLVPAYVTYYREGDGIYPVWMNGQSGHVYGVKRSSQRKANLASLIIGSVAAFTFLIGVLLALLGGALVTPVAIGTGLVILGLILGIIAPIPAISVWFRNRQAGATGQGT